MSGGGRASTSARLANRAPRATAGSSAGNSTGNAESAGQRGGVDIDHDAVERILLDGLHERPGERARVLAELGHSDMRLPGGVHEVVEHDRWVVGLFAAQGGLNALVTVHGARSGHGRGAVGSDRLSVGKGEGVRAPALAQYTNKVEAHRSQGESTLDTFRRHLL